MPDIRKEKGRSFRKRTEELEVQRNVLQSFSGKGSKSWEPLNDVFRELVTDQDTRRGF